MMDKAIIDISQTYVSGMLKYPSVADFHAKWMRHYSIGSDLALSQVTFQSHLGTHIDAPYHFIESGKRIGELPLSTFIGEAQVLDCVGYQKIDRSLLLNKYIGAPRVLFKTDNSHRIAERIREFSNVFLTVDGCEYLVEKRVQLVGIDFFSVDEKGDKDHKAHFVLLGNGIPILEGINLSSVNEGFYMLSCLPLDFGKLEAAPCRAVLEQL